jgi:hypothetical protein
MAGLQLLQRVVFGLSKYLPYYSTVERVRIPTHVIPAVPYR